MAFSATDYITLLCRSNVLRIEHPKFQCGRDLNFAGSFLDLSIQLIVLKQMHLFAFYTYIRHN